MTYKSTRKGSINYYVTEIKKSAKNYKDAREQYMYAYEHAKFFAHKRAMFGNAEMRMYGVNLGKSEGRHSAYEKHKFEIISRGDRAGNNEEAYMGDMERWTSIMHISKRKIEDLINEIQGTEKYEKVMSKINRKMLIFDPVPKYNMVEEYKKYSR